MITICIITYNRSNYLEGLLKNLLPIKRDRFFKIHIFDNASTDNTRKIYLKYNKIFKYLNFSKKNKNLGTAKNILSAFKKTNSKFIWIFGDDDRINIKGLILIKKILSKNNENLPGFTINCYYKNKIDNYDLTREISKNISLSNFNVELNLSKLGQISSQIFNLELIKKNNLLYKLDTKKIYPHLEIWRRTYNLNKNWKFYQNKIVFILRHQITYSFKKNNKALEGFKWRNKIKLFNFLKFRLKKEVNEYLGCIDKLLIDNNQKNKANNNIFVKNLRPWIIENLKNGIKIDLKIKETINRKINFKNYIFFNLLINMPRYLLILLIKFKRIWI